MKLLIFLLLIIFPLGQLGRVSVFGNELVFHLNDLVVGLFVVFCLFRDRSAFLQTIKRSPLTKPLALFLSAVILSLLFNLNRFSPREIFIAALYPIRFFAYAGLFFALSAISATTKKFLKRWLLISVVIIALFGFLQYIFVPDVSFLSALDWDDHYYRLISSFLDPGFTGAILGLGLILSVVEGSRHSGPSRISLITSIYVAFALTYSRASYLMYLVAFGAVALYKKSLKIFLTAALILGVTVLILPKSAGEGTKLERENSVIARIRNWQESVQIWSTAPLFGVGFDTYRYVRNASSQSHAGAGADSSILLVLATTGVLGFLSYLSALVTMWQIGKKSLLFKASFLGILTHSFFNNTLFYPWVMEWLWVLLALVPSEVEGSHSKD